MVRDRGVSSFRRAAPTVTADVSAAGSQGGERIHLFVMQKSGQKGGKNKLKIDGTRQVYCKLKCVRTGAEWASESKEGFGDCDGKPRGCLNTSTGFVQRCLGFLKVAEMGRLEVRGIPNSLSKCISFPFLQAAEPRCVHAGQYSARSHVSCIVTIY